MTFREWSALPAEQVYIADPAAYTHRIPSLGAGFTPPGTLASPSCPVCSGTGRMEIPCLTDDSVRRITCRWCRGAGSYGAYEYHGGMPTPLQPEAGR